MESLTCPKCHGAMRSYERSSVVVDQCSECRGIFLDRGELERLVDAEAQFNAQAAAPPPPPQPDYGRYERGYGDHGYRQPYRKKRKSFMEELFD